MEQPERVASAADTRAPSPEERARVFELRQAARFGPPTLEHLRRAYAGWGLAWPGDDEVRTRHLVADVDAADVG